MKVPEFFFNAYYLSKEDLLSFEKFLDTPFFNPMDSQLTVYRIIKKNYDYILLQNYDELKSLILTKTDYTENTLRKILSYLNDNYIKFTKIQAVMTEQFSDEYFYCDYMLKKGNYRLVNSRIGELDKTLLNPANHDNDYFIKMFKKDVLKYDVICTTEDKFNVKSKIYKQKHYTLESTKNLTVYTLAKTTINLVNYVFQSTDIEEYNNGFFPIDLDNIFRFMGTPKYQMFNKHQKQTINLYYKVYLLFSNPLIDAHYYDYKDYYNNIKQEYNLNFKKTHHSILMNYCFLRQRVSDKDGIFIKEALKSLYEYIKNRYYVTQKTEYLHPINYRNFVVYCLNANDKNLLLKFIRQHTDKLHPKEIKSMKVYGMAQYYYLNGEYELSIVNAELLNNAKSHYKYDILNLLIKANYELENFERIRELLHNYKGFIKKDVLLTNTDKTRYNLFVSNMSSLLNNHNNYLATNNIFDYEYLLKQIEGNTYFSLKNWITERINNVISTHHKKYTKNKHK